MTDNQGKGWHGDPEGHAQAGSGNQNASQNLTHEDRVKGGKASSSQQNMSKLGHQAQESGNAHELTDEERSKGGKIGGSK